MQTEGISPLENTYMEENNDFPPRGVPPPALLGDRPPNPHQGFNHNVRPRGRGMRGGFNGNFSRGGRPPFNRGGNYRVYSYLVQCIYLLITIIVDCVGSLARCVYMLAYHVSKPCDFLDSMSIFMLKYS